MMFLWLNSWRMSISTAKSESSCNTRSCDEANDRGQHDYAVISNPATFLLLLLCILNLSQPRQTPAGRSWRRRACRSPCVEPCAPEQRLHRTKLNSEWRLFCFCRKSAITLVCWRFRQLLTNRPCPSKYFLRVTVEMFSLIWAIEPLLRSVSAE